MKNRPAILGVVTALLGTNKITVVARGRFLLARIPPTCTTLASVGDTVILEQLPRSTEWYLVANLTTTSGTPVYQLKVHEL